MNQSKRDERNDGNIPPHREALWNVVEPGDNYDIKKSMIQKMVNHSKLFMGDNLALVCLLQSAQIQRLSEFLDEYKLRYRELERKDLDRHSYEVQIKELMEEHKQSFSLQNELNRYKEFSRKQSFQIEELIQQKNNGVEWNNYEIILQRLKESDQQNVRIKTALDECFINNSILSAKLEAMQKATSKEIQIIKASPKNVNESEYQRMKIYYQNQLRGIELEVRKLQQINEYKIKQVNELNVRYDMLMRERSQYSSSNQHMSILQSQIRERNEQITRIEQNYEKKFFTLGHEIAGLNMTMSNMHNNLLDSENKKKELDLICFNLSNENRELHQRERATGKQIAYLKGLLQQKEEDLSKYKTGSQLIEKYQSQIRSLQLENTTIRRQSNYHIEEANKAKQELTKISLELSKFSLNQKQNSQLKSQMEELLYAQKKIVEHQNNIAFLMDQCQNKDKVIDMERAKAHQQYKRHLYQIQENIKNKYQEEIKRRLGENQQKIFTNRISLQQKNNEILKEKEQLTIKHSKEMAQVSRKLIQSQNKILQCNNFIRQFQNHQATIVNLTRQKEGNVIKIRNLQSEVQILRRQNAQQKNTFNLQSRQNIDEIQQKLRLLVYQNEDLKKRTSQTSNCQRKIAQLQQRKKFSDNQLRQIIQTLNKKTDECSYYENNCRKLQYELSNLKTQFDTQHRFDGDLSKKSVIYEQNVLILKKQNEELKKNIQDLSTSISIKTTQNSSMLLQLQRTTNTIKQFTQQRRLYESKIAFIGRENQQLKNRENEIRFNFDNLRKQKEQMKSLLEKFNRIEANSNSIVQLNQLRRERQSFIKQISNANNMILTLRRQKQDFVRKSSPLQNPQQIQRLNSIIRARSEQTNKLNERLQKLIYEYNFLTEKHNKLLKQNQHLIIQIKSLQQRIQRNKNTTINNDTYAIQISEFNLQIEQKNQQIKYLNKKLEQTNSIQFSNLSRRLAQNEARLHRVMQQNQRLINDKSNNKIIELETQIYNLTERYNLLVEDSNMRLTKHQQNYLILIEENKRLKANGTVITQNDLQQLQVAYENVSHEYQQSRQHYEEYQNKINALKKEFQQCQIIIKSLREQRNSIIEKNRALANQIMRMKNQFSYLNEQLLESQRNNVNKAGIQKHLSDQLCSMVVLFAEIQSLRKINIEKSNQIEQMRNIYVANNTI